VLARPPGLRARRDAAPMLLSAGQQSVVDISCPPVTQQQTPQQRRVDDGTDGRTRNRYMSVWFVSTWLASWRSG